MRDPVKFISLGAGVQSTTLTLMAARGEFGKDAPKVAVFADTGWEPLHVYRHLKWLENEVKKYGMKIIKSSRRFPREDFLRSLDGGGRAASIPLFVKKPDGKSGMLWRQCTKEYKIDVVRRAIRKYLGYKPRQHVKEKIDLWMGISTDEIQRVKPSRVKYITNKYPLIDREMSRMECLRWMYTQGYPLPPKSACIGCPYHNDDYWRELKANYPDDFDDAVEFDRLLRRNPREQDELYLHRSCVPLSEIDFEKHNGQDSLDFFDNECEGMCGI